MNTTHDTHCHHHFEWGVVFAGTAVATAISIVLMQFGSIIGLSSDYIVTGEAGMTHWAVIAIGLWLLAIQLAASATGGYMAGRLRSSTSDLLPHENEVRDGFYGLTVWAASTVAVFVAISVGSALFVSIDAADDAVDLAPDLLDKEQNAAIIFAFILGATSLISAVISWASATLGGDHRDSRVDHSHFMSFKGK